VTILAGVLVASLMGSIHCAAMCGAFVCTYVGARGHVGRGSLTHGAYHAGRLVSYAFLGMVAGTLGAGVSWAGGLAGVQRAAAILSGSLMTLWASATIAGYFGIRAGATAPEWTTRVLGALLLRARNTSPVVRAASTGLLTTILPCGWLYVFVATAAGTGSAASGALTMSAFWLGTIPALLVVGSGTRRVFGRFGRKLPIASAVLVLVMGLLAIGGRMHAGMAHADTPHAALVVHGH
jgi:sulfite exporter TauE/SafE